MKVVAYLGAGMTQEFPARNFFNAREIANRIITEGLWFNEDGNEVFIPSSRVYKVKIVKESNR